MRKTWMKNLVLLLLWLVVLTGCEPSSKEVKVTKNAADFTQLFFFETAHRIIGIDPETFEVKTNLQFEPYVTYGEKAPDGRIFVADEGQQIGQWGQQVFVLDRKNLLTHKLSVFPNSRNMKVLQNRLILGNSAYTAEGYTGLQIFDLKTYEKLYEAKDVGNIILQRNIHAYKDFAYIGVPAFAPKNRASYILRINLTTLEREDLSVFTADHPYDRFDLLIVGDELIVTFNESREIQVFDLASASLIRKISVREQVDIPETDNPTDYWLSDPQILGSKLLLFMTDNLPEVLYQKLVIYDRTTWTFLKVVDLDTRHNLRFFNCRYNAQGRLWVQNGEYIAIYEAETGQLVRDFQLGADGTVR